MASFTTGEQPLPIDVALFPGGDVSTDGTPPRQDSSSDTEPSSLVCDVCGKTYPKQHLLNKHYRTHEPPLECPHDACDKKLAQKKELRRHILSNHRAWAKKQPQWAHLSSELYRCTRCDYETDRHDNLKRHVDKRTCQKTGR